MINYSLCLTVPLSNGDKRKPVLPACWNLTHPYIVAVLDMAATVRTVYFPTASCRFLECVDESHATPLVYL